MLTKQLFRLFTCIIFILPFYNQKINSQCIAPVIYPRMGVNLDGISDYGSARIFTDFCKESNLREGPNDNSNYWGPYGGNLGDAFNASGWPSTPFLLSMVESDSLSMAFCGTYLVQYLGPTSAIATAGNLTNITNIGGGYTQATLKINYGAGNQWIVFNAGVSNLQIIPTALNGKATGYTFANFPTFNPTILNDYKSFTLYRFMTWGNTNGDSLQNWSDRTVTGGVQSGDYGVAYEYMIDICNASAKDMWINIPVMATNDFIKQLATLLLKNLRTDKNIYIEYGNEVWNFAGGFDCFGWNLYECGNVMDTSAYYNTILRGQPSWVGGQDAGSIGTPCVNYGLQNRCGFSAWQAGARYQGLRTKQISDIFASVWGQAEINNRIRVVLGGQFGYGGYGYGYNIAIDLDFIQKVFGLPGNYLYAIAVAPYLGMSAPYPSSTAVNNSDSLLNGMDTTLNHMFLFHTGTDGNVAQMEGFRGICRQYGLRLNAYEGGPDFDYTTGWDTAKMNAKRSPRMKQLCIDYWTDWYEGGSDGQFNLFEGGYSSQYQGLYSWCENIHDSSQVRQAVDYIMKNPNPPLKTEWTIPDTIDCRKIYGWQYCGDMIQCSYGEPVGEPFTGNMYNHPGMTDAWLFSSNVNADFQISLQADFQQDGNTGLAKASVWLDGDSIGIYSVQSQSGTVWYSPLVIGGLTSIPITYGTHVIQFRYITDNGNLYWLAFKQEAPIPPAEPSKPQGEINICSGGQPGINYFIPYDPSVCLYQWLLTGNSMTIVGAANLNTLIINYTSGFSSGTMKVRGASITGTDTSFSPWSPVLDISSITCGFQANNLTPCVNDVVSFTGVSTGSSDTWTWTFGDSTVVTGATTSTPTVKYTSPGLKNVFLTINAGTDSAQTYQNYAYIDVSACTTPVVSFTVDSTSFCAGNSVTFTGNVSGGTASSWNWNFGTGATPQTASTQIANVVFSSGGGKTITLTTNVGNNTQTITFTQNPLPTQPGSITGSASICTGTNANMYSVTDVAGVTYKWSYTGTGASLTPNTNQVSVDYADNATSGNISVTTTNSCGTSTPTTEAITINDLPAQPGSITGSASICAGTNANMYSVTDVGGVTYDWSYSGTGASLTPNTNQVSIDFADNATSGDISVTATNSCGTSTSSSLSIAISTPPVPGTLTGGTFINPGNTVQLTLTGYTGGIVMWQYGVSPYGPSNWKDTLITTPIFTTQKLYITTRFRAIVNNSICGDSTSGFATVNVVPNNAGSVTGGSSICYGDSDIVLTLKNFTGNIANWEYASYPNFQHIILPENDSVITTAPLFRTTWFWAVVVGLTGDTIISQPDSIVVTPKTVAGKITGNNPIQTGGTASLSLNAYEGTVVTWQQSVSPFNTWTNVANSNDSTGISLTLTQTTKFRTIVNNGVCGLDTSAIYTVNVAGNKGILTADEDTVCSGTNTTRLELIGCRGTVNNWQTSGTIIGPWTNQLPGPDTIYNLTGITATTYVRVLITFAAQADTSNIVSVMTVNAPQTGSLTPTKNSVCSGGNITITLSGNTAPVQSWISSTDRINWNTIPGVSASQILSQLLLTTNIAVVEKNSVCPADTTTPVVISVLPAPLTNLVVLGDSNCSGQTATVTIENREPGVSYSLKSSGKPVSATADSSTGNYILTTSKAVTSTTLYKIIASNQAACVDTLSGTATVTILQLNPQLSGAFNVCPGDTDVLYSITKEPGHTYTINVTGDTTVKDSGVTDILISWKSNVPKGTIIISDSITKYGCGIIDTFNVKISDSTAPVIICAKDIQLKENIADIQNNVYQYPVVSNELQPLQIQDNCGSIFLLNNYNNTDSIKAGTYIPISVAGSGNIFEKTILWTVVNVGQKEATCKVSINVTINDQLQPMSAFSPNGDGVNEYWVITNIERYPDATVEVFNRWGERVFESKSNYNNDWNGSNLPVDSYHYVITQNGKMLCRGVVTIIR